MVRRWRRHLPRGGGDGGGATGRRRPPVAQSGAAPSASRRATSLGSVRTFRAVPRSLSLSLKRASRRPYTQPPPQPPPPSPSTTHTTTAPVSRTLASSSSRCCCCCCCCCRCCCCCCCLVGKHTHTHTKKKKSKKRILVRFLDYVATKRQRLTDNRRSAGRSGKSFFKKSFFLLFLLLLFVEPTSWFDVISDPSPATEFCRLTEFLLRATTRPVLLLFLHFFFAQNFRFRLGKRAESAKGEKWVNLNPL